VALNLYLDDCANSNLLADLLRQAGHRVVRPTDEDVGLEGEDDPIHFAFAAANGLTLLTKNPADFKALHDLDQRHNGILAVYQDNDISRDMSNAEIVRAVRNLEEAFQQGGPPIPKEFHTLNDWRY
jgi:predicted nuclease of predicted toxin-antitoxin system